MSDPHNNKHEFAFYLENTSSITRSLSVGNELVIDDKIIYHRISHVLRLNTDDIFFIFDHSQHIKFQLQHFEKKRYITGKIVEKNKNKILKPTIEFWLPLLKKDNFEMALYTLVELGVQSIQPVITEKSQPVSDLQKRYTRYQKIILSAAEQSKNFAFPILNKNMSLRDLLHRNNNNNKKIYFDPAGDTLWDVISTIKSNSYDKLCLMVGPEGDLLKKEKELLKENKFMFCKLTPTILRSFQAITVGLGAFRSLI